MSAGASETERERETPVRECVCVSVCVCVRERERERECRESQSKFQLSLAAVEACEWSTSLQPNFFFCHKRFKINSDLSSENKDMSRPN